MGTVIRLVVTLSLVGFIYSLFFGRGRAFGRFIFRLTLPVIAFVTISSYMRGVWIPNAGGGLAVDSGDSADIAYEDHAVNIPAGPDQEEHFEHCLEYYIDQTSSKIYSPELSHMMIALCNSIHDEETIKQAFDNLGFPEDESCREFNYRMEDILLAYGMCRKQLPGGTEIVLITARGTGNAGKEILSNFNAAVNHYGRHTGFSDAAEKLHRRLMGFLGNNADFSNTIFILTGHSRGAAAVNITAAMLADEGIPQNHIYCYAFACPDTAFLSDTEAEAYQCIYNIGNANDIVSWIPWNFWKESGANYGFAGDTHWNKYGQSFWFSESDWKGELNAGIENFIPEHDRMAYLDFLRKKSDLYEYKKRSEASELIDSK